jgi:hypothetical protein
MTGFLKASTAVLVLHLMCYQLNPEQGKPPVVSLNESVVDVEFGSSDGRVVAKYITTEGEVKLYTLSSAEVCLLK